MYSSILSLTSAIDGVGDQGHAPADLPRGKPGTPCCIGGWVGPRALLHGCRKTYLTGIRSLDRPASSESLYRLRYPADKYSDHR